MARPFSSHRRLFASLVAALGWAALALQLYLTLTTASANGKTLFAGLIIYFRFFTVLTNILAAVSMTRLALSTAPSDSAIRFSSATTAWMIVVGLIYSLLLRSTWSPQGWQKVADVLLHDALPLLVVLFWLSALPKGHLRLTSPVRWLVYPLAYLAATLLLGPVLGDYPYPFVDVSALGYTRVLLNSAGITLGFLGIGFVLVALDSFLSSNKAKIVDGSIAS